MTTLMTNWPLRDELPLAALPNAAYWARRHTEEVLRDWRLGADEAFIYRVKLVVSELVTNAADQPANDRPRGRDEHPVRLRLFSDGSAHVLVEVGDQSDEPPAPRIPDLESEAGRGLFLVETSATARGGTPPPGRTTRPARSSGRGSASPRR